MLELQGRLIVVIRGLFVSSHKSPSMSISFMPFPGTCGSNGSKDWTIPVDVSLIPGILRHVGEYLPLQLMEAEHNVNCNDDPFRLFTVV